VRGSLFIAWDEQTSGTRRVVAAQGAQAQGDAVRLTRQAVGGAERGEYPAVAAVDDGFAVAWTRGSSTQSVVRFERIPIH
jgi:hypothetical protein